jgi:hypothetical protein
MATSWRVGSRSIRDAIDHLPGMIGTVPRSGLVHGFPRAYGFYRRTIE